MVRKRVKVKGGWNVVRQLLEEFKRKIYKYNSLIAGTGFYLKPTHIVVKRTPAGVKRYIYIGRYWWSLEYRGRKGKTSRVKWVYVGTEKPAKLAGYPDPPSSPLIGLSLVVEGDDIILDEETYRKFRWLFKGLPVETVK